MCTEASLLFITFHIVTHALMTISLFGTFWFFKRVDNFMAGPVFARDGYFLLLETSSFDEEDA